MAVSFRTFGPYSLDVERNGKTRRLGRYVRSKLQDALGEDDPRSPSKCGCYVFGLRFGRHITPYYVGKATRQPAAFEALSPRNKAIYERLIAMSPHKEPVVFILVPVGNKGRSPAVMIEQLEAWLIDNAWTANQNLENVSGLHEREWKIEGVVGTGRGRPSGPAQALRATLEV